jgi:hypothetical protein
LGTQQRTKKKKLRNYREKFTKEFENHNKILDEKSNKFEQNKENMKKYDSFTR